MTHVAVSWAFAQTVDGVLQVTRDAALAASGDNVQPIALLACERFGATLAISSLTRHKIEAMIRQQAKSPVHKFLLAKIGYARGGSIDVLSKSTEGIRFLSLAAALISTESTFDAATALEKMVKVTAEDRELVPTVYQLKDLLDVLEPALNKARFLDEVVGYQTLFFNVTNKALTANIAIPSPEAIYELVKSFGELSRLGSEDTRSLKITVGQFAPWVSAIANWSTEVPPRIYYQPKDEVIKTILDQQDSTIVICISNDAKYKTEIEIETIYAYGSAPKVVSAIVTTERNSKAALATGMVSLKVQASLTLKAFGLDDDLGLRACKQVAPYAIHHIWSNFARTSASTQFKFQKSNLQDTTLHLLNPFPDKEAVAAVMRIYLKMEQEEPLKPLNGLKFTDLPLVNLWIQNHHSFLERRPEAEFFRRLSHIVADILALSLIVAEELLTHKESNILLLYLPDRPLSELFKTGSQWQEYIERIFQYIEQPQDVNSQRQEIDEKPEIESVITWALKLVGHDVSNVVNRRDWVASSYRGQVLLPSILLANEIPVNGFACLSYFPGTLMLENERNRQFFLMLSKGTSYTATDLEYPNEISAQLNIFPNEAIQWKLSGKPEHLEVSMGWTLKGNGNNQRPLNVIITLMGTVMMSNCSHQIDARLSVSGPALLPPGSNRLFAGNSVQDNEIVAYPLHGNEQLKLLALASIIDMMTPISFLTPIALINRGACLDYVIGKCNLIECGYVIL
jgi:hypothetical protein